MVGFVEARVLVICQNLQGSIGATMSIALVCFVKSVREKKIKISLQTQELISYLKL